MSDNYYRKIKKNIDDTKYKLQLSAMTLNINNSKNDIDEIKSNISEINNNKNNILSNLSKIENNENIISNNLGKIDNFTQYILKSLKDFEQTHTIEKQIFRLNKNAYFYTIFEKEIEYDFIKNSLLFVENNMYYKYDNLSNDHHRLQHEYNVYDDEDILIHKYLFNKDTYYDVNLDPILRTGEDFCICFKKKYKKIKLNLQLHRHNRHGIGNINLEIDDNNDNYINIDYLDKDNEDIEKNKEDIASNLSEITYIKDNSKSYLKNVYNLFYADKEQVDFNNNFYNKTFEVNAKKMILLR